MSMFNSVKHFGIILLKQEDLMRPQFSKTTKPDYLPLLTPQFGDMLEHELNTLSFLRIPLLLY